MEENFSTKAERNVFKHVCFGGRAENLHTHPPSFIKRRKTSQQTCCAEFQYPPAPFPPARALSLHFRCLDVYHTERDHNVSKNNALKPLEIKKNSFSQAPRDSERNITHYVSDLSMELISKTCP